MDTASLSSGTDAQKPLTATAGIRVDETKAASGKNFGRTNTEAYLEKRPHYGSLAADPTVMEDEVNFKNAVAAWGEPIVSLIWAWLVLLEVYLVLLVLTVDNQSSGTYTMRCTFHFPEVTPGRLLCDVSYVSVVFFPIVVRCFTLVLLTWRVLRQRLFYVFLRRKIVIDMDDKSHMEAAASKIQLLFLGLVIIHWCLIIAYGYGSTSLTDIKKERMLHGSTLEFFLNPMVLFEDKNKELFNFLAKCTFKYLVPSLWALRRTHQIAATKRTLMPINSLCDSGAESVYVHLGDSIAVHEAVCREILQFNLDGNAESLVCSKADEIKDMNIHDTCEAIRKEALQFKGVHLMGDVSTMDMEGAAHIGGEGEKETSLPTLGYFEILLKQWWPLASVLKEDDEEEAKLILSFRQVWRIHVVLASIWIIMEMNLRITGFSSIVLHGASGDGKIFSTTAFSNILVSTCFAVLSIRLLVVFIRSFPS